MFILPWTVVAQIVVLLIGSAVATAIEKGGDGEKPKESA